MKYCVPIECIVTLGVIVNGVDTKAEAVEKAHKYWKDNYDIKEIPCFVEGAYVNETGIALTHGVKELGDDSSESYTGIINNVRVIYPPVVAP